MTHLLWLQMPGRKPELAGRFDSHMQACWTMLAVCVALPTLRAAWVVKETPAPVRAERCCYGSAGE